MIPQPMRYPASRVPPASVESPPATDPVKVPPTRYSRDVIAVVSGATGNRDSFLPDTVNFNPSGAARKPGAADAIAPVSGAGALSATGTGAGAGAGAGSSGSA